MDLKSKKERIEAIDNEVGELHPLLKEIFVQLPNIDYVEYTHGPNEMGADFVIEKSDPVLGTKNYVGVVVKTDKILQNFADVERQIDECAVPRLIRNGIEKTRLPETWVITSKSVSQNAKDKIHEKYSTRIIQFFSSEWLVEKVDKYVPHYWDQLSNAIGTYLSQLDKRMSVINTQTLIQSNASAPIGFDVDVQEVDWDRYAKANQRKKPRLVNLIDEVILNKVSWLEAEMGFGKSFLARNLVSHYCSSKTYKSSKVVPIFDSFKTYMGGASLDLDGYLKNSLGESCYKDACTDGAIFLVVLDGVDEACADIDLCKDAIKNISNEAKLDSRVRLLITSRPLKPFDDTNHLSSSVKRYQIRPLSLAKILGFLKTVLETNSLPGRLLQDLGRSDLFKQLPQNPIAATLLANLLAQDRCELPSNLTELYSKTIEFMMGRWDEKRQISTEKLYKATERLARFAARHMIDNHLIYVAKSELRGMFAQFLAERNIGVPLDEACEYLFSRSGLFGEFADTEAVFFKHRSFAEYLYAKDVYETRKFDIDERAFHPYWANTYYFYIGSLGECPDVLSDLLNKRPDQESYKFLRFMNMANFMLAGYQTPYSTIESSLEVLLVDAARMYIECRDGKMFSKLGALSEMRMLWLWAMTVRYYYGYRFFEKALPLVMAKIDDSLLDTQEEKIYALFFAASALKEIDNGCGFEFLMKNKGAKNMPLPINLAMRAEIEHGTKEFGHSAVVKGYEKALKKLLYVQPEDKLQRAAKIEALFKEPLTTKNQALKTKEGASSKR